MFAGFSLGQSALLTDIAMCLNHYRLLSPGLYCCVCPAVQLDEHTRCTAGVVLQVNHGPLKRCAPDEKYQAFVGPPNFVLDVYHAQDMADYPRRRAMFEAAGVLEYVAVRDSFPLEWNWNQLHGDAYREAETMPGNIIASSSMPGLWISVHAFQNRDWWTVMATIERGTSRLGHHVFMDTVWNAKESRTEQEEQQLRHDYLSGELGRRA